ncbi:hypothetical protein LCGC14_1728810 [marine sediment metagenome]|uniref:HNH endonuclease n=1 Tax=marine sediment metagenome TaxID=412755 RepID=A0A0F9K9X5_9ZZZZ
MIKLTAELIPKTSWYNNVRSNVPRSEWDKIRKQVYAEAKYVCKICNGVGKKHPVECHEIWQYDEKKHIQKLVGMIALCPACHCVKHLGRARAVGIFHLAIEHLMKINDWDYIEAKKYTDDVFEEWKRRSQHNWKLDLGALKKIYIRENRE